MYLPTVSTDTNGNQRYQRYRDIYRETVDSSSLSGNRKGKHYEKVYKRNLVKV